VFIPTQTCLLKHVMKTLQSCFAQLRLLFKSKSFLSNADVEKIIFALISPIILMHLIPIKVDKIQVGL